MKKIRSRKTATHTQDENAEEKYFQIHFEFRFTFSDPDFDSGKNVFSLSGTQLLRVTTKRKSATTSAQLVCTAALVKVDCCKAQPV
ncbi:hypothetical protein CEXT_203931 [Caerostris extrusa]|uniref:SHSP domain-containing protein n=1 Tax=Caerostris extrusa TaxID=172846 RepID=A0AAV4MTD8_CAEEX|nr:hypothetical protein CEXT_203931 [Caerostris extrusa]